MYYKPAFILLYKIKLYYIYSYSYMNFFGSIQESTISDLSTYSTCFKNVKIANKMYTIIMEWYNAEIYKYNLYLFE